MEQIAALSRDAASASTSPSTTTLALAGLRRAGSMDRHSTDVRLLGGRVALAEPLLALDREVRDDPVEPAREPPVRPAHEDHHRRDQQAADQRRVDGDRDAHADAELLDGRV